MMYVVCCMMYALIQVRSSFSCRTAASSHHHSCGNFASEPWKMLWVWLWRMGGWGHTKSHRVTQMSCKVMQSHAKSCRAIQRRTVTHRHEVIQSRSESYTSYNFGNRISARMFTPCSHSPYLLHSIPPMRFSVSVLCI